MHFLGLQRKLKKVPFIFLKSLDYSITPSVLQKKEKEKDGDKRYREKNRIKYTAHKIHGIIERDKENMGFKMLFEDVY